MPRRCGATSRARRARPRVTNLQPFRYLRGVRMFVRRLTIAACLFGAAPLFAQAPQSQASNWDVFLKLYPKRALAAKEEGAVGFTVTLDNKGDVTNCQVTQSSGHPLLDEETCKLITLNAVFKPDPNLSPSQTKTSP